jgi:predicted PhzF superfamily epimerase YddE/YHI9
MMQVGVDEDPVCGSAHCFLGPHWAGRLGKSTLVSACLSPRGGTVRVRLEGERVVLGGQAVLTMQGELTPTACKACSSSSAA